MTQGRHKKSAKLNKLHGNPGKRKPKKQTFTASDAKLGIPHGLNQEVRDKARQVAHYLRDEGAPIELLRPMFERYCKHLQFAKDASDELRNEGVTNKGKKHPAAQIWKDNSDAAFKLEQYFAKVLKDTKPKPKGEDPLKKFMKKGKKLEAVP